MEQEIKNNTENIEAMDQRIANVLGELKSSVKKMNRSARIRGFIEGTLATIGGVVVVGGIATIIVKLKEVNNEDL